MEKEEKLNLNKMYSAISAMKFLEIKSRQYVTKYIKEGKLRAIIIGNGGDVSTRYAIKGSWIASFLERREKGVFDKERFTKEELKLTLNDTIAYCKENNITTLQQLIDKKNEQLGKR